MSNPKARSKKIFFFFKLRRETRDERRETRDERRETRDERLHTISPFFSNNFFLEFNSFNLNCKADFK